MAQGPPPPQPYWPPPVRTTGLQSSSTLIGAIIAVVMVAIFAVFFLGVSTSMMGFGFPTLMFLPFCGFFIIVIVIIVLSLTQGMSQPRIPPPPPIQQPMVPAGIQGAVALSCPNCGAPPQNVDRFGVATCPYCSTRFLVR